MYVEILILAHLAHRPRHGYEIKKDVGRILGGAVVLNNNQLYPTLKRFQEMGAVSREVERQMGKPDRHVYRLTEVGMEVLQGFLREFPADLARDEAEFLTRVAFFDLLDPAARQDIVLSRQAALEEQLRHLGQMAADAESDEHRYGMRIIEFTRRQVRQELAWIGELGREEGEA